MNWGEFKSCALDVGNWLWGTAQGGFNEKLTVGQIITDAVISMFPIAGEATAARDVIAGVLRLAQYEEKRKEVGEWVGVVLPLLALVPLLGGALKGMGKLLMKIGQDADENQKILQGCIWLLNRVGEGNAVKFIRELDFTGYVKPVKDGVKELCNRLGDGIGFMQKRYGKLIPLSASQHMNALHGSLKGIAAMADTMVPQALKDLNNRLKYIQTLAYQGDWHLIPGAGKTITREAEARLVYDAQLGKDAWKLENAKFPPNTKDIFTPREDWPNLLEGKATQNVDLANGRTVATYPVISAFHGPIAARLLKPRTIIYRVVSPDKWSRAEGAWWTAIDPHSISGLYWRVKFAVLQSWSRNGKYVKYVVKDKPLHAWEGKVSSQIDQSKSLFDGSSNPAYGQYLEGGETQLYIDLEHGSNHHALEEIKNLEKKDTNWTDHMDINIPEQGLSAQRLGKYVIEQKSLTSANLATAANEANHAMHANREH